MTTTRIAFVRLGSARDLTRLEPTGDYAELGVARSKIPI